MKQTKTPTKKVVKRAASNEKWISGERTYSPMTKLQWSASEDFADPARTRQAGGDWQLEMGCTSVHR